MVRQEAERQRLEEQLHKNWDIPILMQTTIVLKGGDMYESHIRFLEDNRRYEMDGSPNLIEQKVWMNDMSCAKTVMPSQRRMRAGSTERSW